MPTSGRPISAFGLSAAMRRWQASAEFVAAAQRGAVDGGDEGLAAGLDAAHQRVQVGHETHHARRHLDGQHHVQVGAGHELGPRRGDDHALDLRVGHGLGPRFVKRRNRCVVEHVHRPRRPCSR
jgi:hypothetical protein